jgi:hypothetical protein
VSVRNADDPWQILDTAPTTDGSTIRKAYVRRLKAIDPEVDPAAFIELRAARDWAMWHAEAGGEQPASVPETAAFAPHASPEALPREPRPALNPAVTADGPDRAAIAMLHAMVLDPASTATRAEITAQAERVLSDPALVNIDEAGRMEDFISQLIVQGAPRSDAMLDPAIRHFRWDADRPELERQPIVGWVAQRQADMDFENGLPNRSRTYADLLRDLRQPALPRHPRWTGWRLGTRAEYLLTYLQQLHPTSLAGADQGKLDWWTARIGEQKAAPLPLRWLREGWRRSIWARGIDQPFNWRVLYLYAGILVAPYLFVWFLLRRGHSMTESVVGFGYLAAILLIGGLAHAPQSAVPRASPSAVAVAATPHYQDFAADMQPVLTGMTSGTVDVATLRARNPALWRSLQEQWQAAAAARTAFAAYQEHTASALSTVLGQALKKGDDKLLTDFARAYNSRLRWAARGSPEECVDMLAGRSRGPSLSDFADYQHRLVGRAILAGTPPPAGPARREGKRLFTIPATVLAEGQRRSMLDKAAFQKGLRDKGSALARCNARIALIDAAVLSGSPASRIMLRALFSPN